MIGVSHLSAGQLLCWLLVFPGSFADQTVLDFVDPFIGTDKGGHVFAGATLPFGMAKAVSDSTKDRHGGFASNDSPLTGFSQLHDSGTGGSPSLGQYPLFPFAGCANDDPSNCKVRKAQRGIKRKKGSEKASPGYFDITLQSDVRAEMTVTNHTSLYRFTFPDEPDANNATLLPLIVQDVTDLNDPGRDVKLDVDADTGRIKGKATYNPSFGLRSYKVMVCTDFKGAEIRETKLFKDDDDEPRGAWVQFEKPDEDNQILVRVGVSFISIQQACDNAEKEIPDFDFEKVHDAAIDAWTEKLSPIEIDAKGVSKDLQSVFWSGIYRTMISPQDYSGENPLWKGKSTEPYYDSFYCIWDSFRATHPLLTLVDPVSQTRMVRTLIDVYRHEGYLPDCRMSLCPGYTQGGSDADILLVDSWIKGIADPKLNWTTGFEAIVKDAEKPTPDWDVMGRGGLPEWKKLGYIPTDEADKGRGLKTRSISRTVEYAYNDFCIAEMAREYGTEEQVDKYLGRAKNWENLYNENMTSNDYMGFLQPRYTDGSWGYQDPTLCSPLNGPDFCYLNSGGHETYEGSCWLYTFFVPQDTATLVKKLGGPDPFVERLDYFHDSGLLYLGDEQSFLTPYLYHWAGRPGLSAKRVHSYLSTQFNTSVNGIPGNDDTGAMGALVAFWMLGFFPNAGQDVYLLSPPFFPEVSIRNPQTGKTATVRNVNFDPEYKNLFIQKATLNGKPYHKNWIKHSFFLEGGVLELTLGPKESKWGSKKKDLPPSMSTTKFEDSEDDDEVSSLSFSSIAGFVVAVAVCGGLWYWYRRRRASQKYSAVADDERGPHNMEMDNEPLMRGETVDDDIEDRFRDAGADRDLRPSEAAKAD